MDEIYHSFDYVEIERALKEIRVQYESGRPLKWTGPSNLHFHVAATSAPPAWHFSDEGLDSHYQQGRNFWDVYTLIAFQIGFHNGVMRMEPEVDSLRRHVTMLRLIEESKEVS